MVDGEEAKWRNRLKNQPRTDRVPDGWERLNEEDELVGGDTFLGPSAMVLLAWLWPERALRKYLVKARIIERWFAPSWLVVAYRITPGVMTDEGVLPFDPASIPASIRTYPGSSLQTVNKGTRPKASQPSMQETLWLALRMHRDKVFRDKALAVYRLGGLAKLAPMVPSKRPRARRGRDGG